MKTKKPRYRNAATGKFISEKVFRKQQTPEVVEGIVFDEKDELNWCQRIWQWIKDLVRLN